MSDSVLSIDMTLSVNFNNIILQAAIRIFYRTANLFIISPIT